MINSNNFVGLETQPWWVERWLELLDSYRFKKRLERGRMYAREGNVLSMEFVGSQAIVKVKGSEPEPYRVRISMALFSKEDWKYVISSMTDQAIISAQLLTGEMPEQIEEVFTANGLSLFPFQLSEVKSRCSCPDKANPCKHVAAAYYQLGDRLREDPFVLFQLRGRTREEILFAMRRLRSQGGKKAKGRYQKGKGKGKQKLFFSTRKDKTTQKQEIANFWQYDYPLDSSLVVISPPTDQKNILEMLGDLPLPYSDAIAVKQSLELIYKMASEEALKEALSL